MPNAPEKAPKRCWKLPLKLHSITLDESAQPAVLFKKVNQMTTPQDCTKLIQVTHQNGNNYCRILSLLGMEEEGNPVAEVERLIAAAGVAPAVEPMLRFCPGCGSVGEVAGTYLDCCPDGSEARVIPAALANKCRSLFQMALAAALTSKAPD